MKKRKKITVKINVECDNIRLNELNESITRRRYTALDQRVYAPKEDAPSPTVLDLFGSHVK